MYTSSLARHLADSSLFSPFMSSVRTNLLQGVLIDDVCQVIDSFRMAGNVKVSLAIEGIIGDIFIASVQPHCDQFSFCTMSSHCDPKDSLHTRFGNSSLITSLFHFWSNRTPTQKKMLSESFFSFGIPQLLAFATFCVNSDAPKLGGNLQKVHFWKGPHEMSTSIVSNDRVLHAMLGLSRAQHLPNKNSSTKTGPMTTPRKTNMSPKMGLFQ